jgi:hypothetical protein
MIRKVTVRKNVITIDWDQADYDFFFLVGMQAMCDEHFGGKRKVVVVPCKEPLDSLKKDKIVEVSDAFADACVEHGVNEALREQINKANAEDAGKNSAKKSAKKPAKSCCGKCK